MCFLRFYFFFYVLVSYVVIIYLYNIRHIEGSADPCLNNDSQQDIFCYFYGMCVCVCVFVNVVRMQLYWSWFLLRKVCFTCVFYVYVLHTGIESDVFLDCGNFFYTSLTIEWGLICFLFRWILMRLHYFYAIMWCFSSSTMWWLYVMSSVWEFLVRALWEVVLCESWFCKLGMKKSMKFR